MSDERYKIGGISKLLGIPTQTLHYYEECGFVAPQRDKNSSYRYYSAWDVNFLLDCKYYQSFELSNADIKELLHTADLSDIQKKFTNQQQAVMERIHHYQRLLETVIEQERLLGQIPAKLGKFEEAYRPALFFHSYRFNNTYQKDGDPNELPEISGMLSMQPFAKPTFTISPKDLSSSPDYRWGFSITPEKAYEMGKNITDPGHDAEYYTSCNCLYSIFKAYGEGTFADCVYRQVLEPILEKGKKIRGDVIGRLVIRAHDKEQYVRYFEIWVPVEELTP